MELITDPSVLFLDEPTTGLDAYTAGSVIKTLRNLALRGRTIILSIHQPKYSIFRLFDNLTIICSGRIAYHGPADQTLNYFRSIGVFVKGVFVCRRSNRKILCSVDQATIASRTIRRLTSSWTSFTAK